MANTTQIRLREALGYGRRVASAQAKAFVRRTPMAPGRLVPGDRRFRTDPDFLIDCAKRLGPIFKIWMMNEVTTCIVGHALGRRFLAESESFSRPYTVDLRPLFPFGTLRAMQGDVHRAYRRKFIEAFKTAPLSAHQTAIAAAIGAALLRLAAIDGPVNGRALRGALLEAVTVILMRNILGVTERSPAFALLPVQLDAFGPTGPINFVAVDTRPAFVDLRATVVAEIERQRSAPAEQQSSLLASIIKSETPDETTIGNLIQFLQTGRHDLLGALQWLFFFLAGAPEFMTRLRGEESPGRLAEAAVLETLRLAQSEYLLRTVTSDMVFDGYLIPKGSIVRICILEGHRDPANFSDPLAFLPDRFMAGDFPPTSYAPFGLDHHRCLGADWVVAIGAMFAETLARDYRLVVASTAPPNGGYHHFEPGPGFAVRLHRLATDDLTIASA